MRPYFISNSGPDLRLDRSARPQWRCQKHLIKLGLTSQSAALLDNCRVIDQKLLCLARANCAIPPAAFSDRLHETQPAQAIVQFRC
ncbi:hypothetical protein [Bradyrhizobium brasilense]|uniref:hypothetical protein n=1 Tax=Bradyrhizobium brasilense TaxID=1419277 RepID=UPI00115F7F54|nr:hypothetical protein [Bradyrhizobium brasilense]